MGCGSSVVNSNNSSSQAACSTGTAAKAARADPHTPPHPPSVKPQPSSVSPEKRSSGSTAPLPSFTACVYRRTSDEDDKSTPPHHADDHSSAQAPSASSKSKNSNAAPSVPVRPMPVDVDVDALRDEIPMMESLSGSDSFASSSSSEGFGDRNVDYDCRNNNNNNNNNNTSHPYSGSDGFMVRVSSRNDDAGSGLRSPTNANGGRSRVVSTISGHDEPFVGRAAHRSSSSGRSSVSLLSDPVLNESFNDRMLNGSGLFEATPRPQSGLATFADVKHECAACGDSDVAYVCDQCDTYWCEECRFKTSVIDSHPPDHTINALHDAQHCNASRTFAESSFCSSDGVSSSVYGGGGSVAGGGASTLLYNPCSVCQRAISDVEVVHRCGDCDFIACDTCFGAGKVSHEHILQRFQRRAKTTVQEKPLTCKKKTQDGNRVINDYAVVRLLGRGGNANVKLVQHTKTRQLYALKILKRPKTSSTAYLSGSSTSGAGAGFGDAGSSSNNSASGQTSRGVMGSPNVTPTLSQRSNGISGGGGAGSGSGAGTSSPRGAGQPTLDDLLREIAVMKFIDHPNIVQLHEVIEDTEAQRAYIIMEYCEGGPMYTFGDPPLSPDTLQQYATDVFRGLQHLHSQYLYHRDIKPANCLVDGHGTVKITDFGTTNSSVMSGQTGTLPYCCPEERKGEPYTGDVKDSWAFAMTLYQLTYGRLPFDQLDYIAIRSALASPESFDFPSEPRVDPMLVDLLKRMLCKDRAKRMLISTAAKHPFFVDLHECSLSTSGTPIAPGRQQLLHGSLVGSQILLGSASLNESDVSHRNKDLYERATASVIRGRNLLNAFHGAKSIQRVRQRDEDNAQNCMLTRGAVATAAAAARENAAHSAYRRHVENANTSTGSGGSGNPFQDGLDLLDNDESIVLDDDDDDGDVDGTSQSNGSTFHLDGGLQVDRSLPSLMSRSYSLPGGARVSSAAPTRAASGATVRARVTFEESMTPAQQDVVLEIIRQYKASPERTRKVLRITDVLMLSPPSEDVESVAGTVVGLHLSRTALANLGSIDLSRFNALKDITLSSNRLTEVPMAVLDAPRLLRLDLSDNRIRRIPPALRHARFLQRLNLHGNNISEVGVDADGHSYFNSTCLRHVRLSSNPLRALPKGLETTTNLELVLDAIPVLTEEWERVVTASRPNPPPAVITWDDSFPQKLPALPVAAWVATAPVSVYRSHILKACGVKHIVIARDEDARFPRGLHTSRALEVYFKSLLGEVFRLKQSEVVAHGGTPHNSPTQQQQQQPSGEDAAGKKTTSPIASPEQSALAAAAVAESWAPLPSVVGKAARAYVASYFFIADDVADGCGGKSCDGGFEDLRARIAEWLRLGEGFLCFVPQSKKDLHEELTVALGLALEDAFGQEWGEVQFDSWLDRYGVL